MNQDRLRAFLRVVELGTVSAAAESLWTSQPALGRRIQALELEIGLSLFDRRGNRLAITSSGRAFVPIARSLLAANEVAVAAVSEMRLGRVRQLSVAATAASARGFLTDFIAGMGGDEPALLVDERHHDTVESALDTGSDLAIVPGITSSDLKSVHLRDLALRVQVRSDHPLAAAEVVTLAELAKHRLVVPTQRSVSRSVLDAAFRGARLRPAELLECDDGPTMLALAASGHGAAVSTETARFGLVVRPIVADEGLTLPLRAAWDPAHFAADLLESYALRMRAFIAETTDPGNMR